MFIARLLAALAAALLLADDATPWRTVAGIHGFDEGLAFHGARSATSMFAQYVTAAGIEEEFYELVSDPYQLDNRVADPACAAAVAFMRQMTRVFASCAGASCWVEDLAPVCDVTP